MKTLNALLLPMVFLFLLAFRDDDNDLMKWNPDQKLTWEDFKGKVPATHDFLALTDYNIGYSYEFYDGIPYMTAACYFSKEGSWSVGDGRTPKLLLHEQHHFDIAEYYTRMFRKYSKRWNKKDDYGHFLETGYDSLWNACRVMQKKYDAETVHSTDATRQKAWNRKVDSLIEDSRNWDASFVVRTQ